MVGLVAIVGCAAGAPPEKDRDASSPAGDGGGGGTGGSGGMSGRDGGAGSGGMSGRDGGAGTGGTGGMGGTGGSSGNDGGPTDGGNDSGPASDCDDGDKNGAETDTDCGGPACDACPEGDTCLEDGDCEQGSACSDSFVCTAPSCDDGELNGDETDEDCGGGCDATCANGKLCGEDADCTSGQCNDADPKVCACAPGQPADVCGAMECGTRPDGCGGMVTCSFTCPDGQDCQGNVCVTPPVCDAANCSNTCFLTSRCCKGDGTCGCQVPFVGCQ